MATFDELNIDVRGNGGQKKVKCPVCSDGRRNKTDKSLSVNLTTGQYNCHNCGWHGVADGKTKEETQQERREWVKQQREYAKPPAIELPLSEKTIQWFASRGITPQTLQYFKVSESKEWMPEKAGHPAGIRTCINFNYYRGEEKINVKYRDGLKNFRLTKEAELILYNLNAAENRSHLLICEGEIDCMTFYQSGYYGAVSVPNGASKGNARLEYLENCAQAFEGKQKIVLATDGDEAGQSLRDELTRRLGSHRCWFVTYPEGCKDANEVLLKYGIEAVTRLRTEATAPPLESILTVEDMHQQLEQIYLHGWPKVEPIGYKGFDQLLNFAPGEVTTITGIPGHGKDEFITQVLIRKAARYGERAAIFNYEEPAWIQTIKLAQKYIGKPYYRSDRSQNINPAQKDAALKFIGEYFCFVDIATADLTIEGLIKKGEELVLRRNIKYYVIGPYNCIEGGRQEYQTEGEYVSKVMQQITRFALKYKVHVFLVAHPTKMTKSNGVYDIPTLYSIAGSANFFNKTHNGITIYRNYHDNTTDVHVQKVKFFFNGELGFQSFNFDVPTGRLSEIGHPFESELDHQQKRLTQLTVELSQAEVLSAQAPAEATQPAPAVPVVEAPAASEPSPSEYVKPAGGELTQWKSALPETDLPF